MREGGRGIYGVSILSPLPMTSPASQLLESASRGEPVSVDDLVPLVYEELRAMAHRQLQRSGPTPSLQTTALVHEAYMKLAGDTGVARRGRAYFFAAAARAIRQVLIDRARRRGAAKRGSGARPVALDEQILKGDAWAEDLLELEDALERLEEIAPRQARVVECRYFVGLTFAETAEALGISERTAKYDWAMARAWLYRHLTPGSDTS